MPALDHEGVIPVKPAGSFYFTHCALK
jgi:hypothetical protein